MLYFLRKIRRRLLAENKLFRYLAYAVGEIVLVVIGILLALQINTWNQNRKDRLEERVLLINLKREFERNLEELHADHAINTRSLDATYFFMEASLNSLTSAQIDSLLGRMQDFATFDASTGYIEQTISSGKLDLIENDTLKTLLSQWSGELNDYREDVVIRRDHWIQNVDPVLRKLVPARNTDFTQDRPDYRRDRGITPMEVPESSYQKFRESLEVDGVLYYYYLNQSYVVINEGYIEEDILNILNLIEGEIAID